MKLNAGRGNGRILAHSMESEPLNFHEKAIHQTSRKQHTSPHQPLGVEKIKPAWSALCCRDHMSCGCWQGMHPSGPNEMRHAQQLRIYKHRLRSMLQVMNALRRKTLLLSARQAWLCRARAPPLCGVRPSAAQPLPLDRRALRLQLPQTPSQTYRPCCGSPNRCSSWGRSCLKCPECQQRNARPAKSHMCICSTIKPRAERRSGQPVPGQRWTRRNAQHIGVEMLRIERPMLFHVLALIPGLSALRGIARGALVNVHCLR